MKKNWIYKLAAMALFLTMCVPAGAQNECADTVAWGERIDNYGCWTADTAWVALQQGGFRANNRADSVPSWLYSPWMAIPAGAGSDPVALVWDASAVTNAEATVLATTDGENYDTLWSGLVYASNSTSRYVGEDVSQTAMLSAYAGQNVRVAIVHQSGSTLFEHPYASSGILYFSNPQLKRVMHPVGAMSVPNRAFLEQPTTLSAWLTEGSSEGLQFTWHSQLMDTTLVGDTVDIVYTTEGVDTLRLVVSNNYASDTLETVMQVYDCSPVTQMPWIVDITRDYNCMTLVSGTQWTLTTLNDDGRSIPILYSWGSAVIATQQVVLPDDTAGLRIMWMDRSFMGGTVPLKLMVSTTSQTDLSAYDTVASYNSGNNFTQRSVDISAYAGQTVYFAFRSGANPSHTLMVKDIVVMSDNMLKASLDVPQGAATNDTVKFVAHMSQGRDSLLSFTWGSTMAEAGDATMTASDSILTMVYTAEGVDTITLTISNAYGAIHFNKQVHIFDCGTVNNFPWEEEFVEGGDDARYNACWQISGWEHYPSNGRVSLIDEDGNVATKNDVMRASTTGSYMISPAISIPSSGAEHLALWANYAGSPSIAISTQGNDLALFTDTVLPYTYNASNHAFTRTIPLAAYAGQTIHVMIICHNAITYFDRLAVDYDTLPRVDIAGLDTTVTDSATVFTAWLRQGSTAGLHYTWTSSLGGIISTNALGDTANIVYGAGINGATDTVRVVATNAFGSDTASKIIRVVDCTPAVTLPWHETFEDGLACWYKPDGSNWTAQSVGSDYHYMYSAGYGGGWIMSKAIDIPSDTSKRVILEWQAWGQISNYWRDYDVMITTSNDYTDTANYTWLYTDTASNYPSYDLLNISLSAYAGQTVHIAFNSHTSINGLIIKEVTVRTTNIPRANIIAPQYINSHEPISYTAQLVEGSPQGLVYEWHSSLQDATYTGEQWALTYLQGGTDTLTLVTSNIFGADTAVCILSVNDCSPISLPYEEDFNYASAWTYDNADNMAPACWRRYWKGAPNYAPHVVTSFPYIYYSSRPLLLMAGSDTSGQWDTVAIVETPIFADTLNRLGLSFFSKCENATIRGMLSVGYMLDSTFISVADLFPTSAGSTYTVSLSDIPDSVDRIALRWKHNNTWMGVIIDNLSAFHIDSTPSVHIEKPQTAYMGDAVFLTASLSSGLPDGLSFTWHSTLLDSTWTTASTTCHIVYDTTGTDNLSIIATNAYGSDSTSATITVAAHPLPAITQLTIPSTTFTYEPATFSASINDCSANNLTCIWHSSLLDSTWITAVRPSSKTHLELTYLTNGVDTITITVSNRYGTISQSSTIHIYNCSDYSVPFYEDFSTSSTIPICWSGAGNITTSSNGTHRLQLQTNFYTGPRVVTLPHFNTPLNQYSFAIHYLPDTYSRYYGNISIGYLDNTGNFITYLELPRPDNLERTDTVNLSSLPDSVHQLSIQWRNSYVQNYNLYIYSVSIFSTDIIYPPTNLHIDSTGAECVQLAWSPSPNATAYHLQLEDILDTLVTDTTALLCNLTPNTQYTAHVAAIIDDDTGRVATITFTSACHIINLPWHQDFEGTSPSACWQTYPSLTHVDSYFHHSGNNALRLSSYNNRIAALPIIEAPADELLVSFWARIYLAGTHAEYGILTTPGDTTTFSPLGTCTDTVWTRYEFDTRSIPHSALFSLAFRIVGNSDVILDDLHIEQLQPCARLRSVSNYALSATSAVVEWQYDTASTLPNIGVLITLTDLTDSSAAPQITSATGTNHTFSNLTPAHRYRALVQTLCSADTSTGIGTLVVPTGSVCAEASGTNSSGFILLSTDRPYCYSQTLYPATLAAPIDTLYGIAYRITSASVGHRNIDVYIGQTSDTTLTSPVSASNLTLAVQNYPLPIDSLGWQHINFTTPVPLDGTSNLIVTIDDNTGTTVQYPNNSVGLGTHRSDFGTTFYTTGSYSYSQTMDPYNPSSFTTYSNTPFRPDIQLLGGCTSSRCLQPIVTITDEDTHSISLGWYQRGSEEQWRVEYRHEADSAWLTAGITTDTSFTISGLNAASGYRLRVVSLCSDQEIPSAMLRGHTQCGIVSLPYHQSFRADWMHSDEGGRTNAVPCWQTGNITLLSMSRGLWCTSQDGAYIVSPTIGANLNMLQVNLTASGPSFFLAGLKVGTCDSLGDNLVWVDTITLNDNATDYTVYLNNYTGPNRHIAIGGRYDFGGWTLYDVVVDYTSNCIPPHHISLGQIDDNSATIHWPAVDELSTWAIYIDDSLIGTSTDTTYTIANLVPNSHYTLGVREICMPGDTSIATTLDIATLCTSPLPWYDDFDNGTYQQLPDCWYPIFRPSTGNLLNAYLLGSTNKYLYFYDHYSPYEDTDTVANFLCSPILYAEGNPLTVSFYASHNNTDASIFQAGIITNPADTASFLPLLTLPQTPCSQRFTFTTDSLTLPDKYCIAFRAWGTPSYSVDSLNVEAPAAVTYTINARSANPSMGTVSGGGTYPEGTLVTLTATPYDGYHFVQWSDGHPQASREIVVTSDRNLVAFFASDTAEPEEYTVFASSADTTMGTVSGSGAYIEGTTVTLIATPNDGYHFVQWNDGLQQASRDIIVVSDTHFVAYFAIDNPQAIDDPEATSYTIRLTEHEIVVSGASGHTAALYNAVGRIVARSRNQHADAQHIDIAHLPSGIYLVKIGALPAQRIAIVR